MFCPSVTVISPSTKCLLMRFSTAKSTIKPDFGTADDSHNPGSGQTGFINNFAQQVADREIVTTTTNEPTASSGNET